MSADDKRFSTLQALAAIRMVELHKTEVGYVAQQWAVTRRFETLDSVAAWLDTFGKREQVTE